MTVFEKLSGQIDKDFAILSQETRDKIRWMVEYAMRDAYERGCARGSDIAHEVEETKNNDSQEEHGDAVEKVAAEYERVVAKTHTGANRLLPRGFRRV